MTRVHLAVPLDRPITAELFRAAFPQRRRSTFVLEGGNVAPRLDRFTFMGAEPVASFRAERSLPITNEERGLRTARVVIEEPAGVRVLSGVDPFDVLREFLAKAAPEPDAFDPSFPFPFRAGLVGYFGYECGQLLERLPCLPRPAPGMPDIALSLYRWVIATSRDTGRSFLSVLGVGDSHDTAHEDARRTRARICAALAAARDLDESRPNDAVGWLGRQPQDLEKSRRSRPHGVVIEASLSRAQYTERIARAKDHITRGDAYEICLTNALRSSLSQAQDQAWPLFDELRRSNPAPFAALLDWPEGAIVSSSPERFLSLDARGIAESRPIKGTRPRGTTPEEDARLATELASSEKDRAENAMIVDLVRNDLGRVCRVGTVEAPELFVVEPYATVHQLVSTVRGELAAGLDGIDLLRACFPPGSMTGAPKIEAMSILETLEPVERGVYSGALGWIHLGGAMDLSVVIRTIVLRDGAATFSVGGAIVADSEPAAEYEETEHKARALVVALGKVRTEEPTPRAVLEGLA